MLFKDHYTEQFEQGTFILEGTNDVLTMALETPEHPGRVRGQSQFTLRDDYFGPNTNSKSRTKDDEIAELKAQVAMLTSEVQRISNKKVASQQAEPSVENPNNLSSKCDMQNSPEGDPIDNEGLGEVHISLNLLWHCFYYILMILTINILLQGTPCKLAAVSRNNIVAEGKVYLKCSPNSLLHGRRLGVNTRRVSIDLMLQPDANLPIQTDESLTNLDAHGGHVSWPSHLVVFGDVQVYYSYNVL